MSRISSLLHRLRSLTGALVLLWLGGFLWFLASSLLVTVDRAFPTDAIVVLTGGGRLRLEAGLELLTAGRAKKLFVSGVNPRVDREALLRALGPSAEREACCIVLGHTAENTLGNARETAVWMHEESYRSLRLVTSWYHMRRSLLEFSRAMPNITIVAYPVFAPHANPDDWSSWYAAAPVVIGEYHKYLATWLRPFTDAVQPTVQSPPVPVIRSTRSPQSGAQARVVGL